MEQMKELMEEAGIELGKNCEVNGMKFIKETGNGL